MNSGEVPNLMAFEDLEEIFSEMRSKEQESLKNLLFLKLVEKHAIDKSI